MKLSQIVFTATLLANLPAQAVEVVKAQLDAKKENILVTVRHGGGCGDHSYELDLEGCAESSPVQCQATIKHMTNDFCEAYLTREAKFNLQSYGLKDKYYQNGTLTIKGSNGTKSMVTLSSSAVAKPVTTTQKVRVRCLTHTGSQLSIQTSKVTLNTVENQTAEYDIVNVDAKVYEVMPAIYNTVYKLSDGRSLETNFREGKTEGKGKFIRIDGTRSPEFTCKQL